MILINLLPWRERTIRKNSRIALWLLLLACVIYLFIALLALRWINGNLQQLKENITWLKPALQKVETKLQEQAKLLHIQTTLQATQRYQQRQWQKAQQWKQFLLQLGEIIPPQVWLTAMEKKADALRIDGVSKSTEQMEVFCRQLRQKALFSRVSRGEIVRQSGEQISFNIVARLHTEVTDE